MPKEISKSQTRTVRSLAAQYLRGGDDAYREWLYETFPAKEWDDPSRPSTLELTGGQANRAIRALLRIKYAAQGSGDSVPGRPQAPTPTDVHRTWAGHYDAEGGGGLTQEQADEIARLEYEMGWQNNPDRLEGFIDYQLSDVLKPAELSKAQATNVITGMRRLAMR